ncbi:MAG: hypothetical protein CMJ64_03355 [Planctomycetaceae bacterium]|nr:hypothetical protein [Planctomycetaceae bacterium]
MEPGDGATLQLIYGTDTSESLVATDVRGEFMGQRHPILFTTQRSMVLPLCLIFSMFIPIGFGLFRIESLAPQRHGWRAVAERLPK